MSSTNIDVNDYIIYFTTTEIDSFKILFDTIQKLKNDSFITFYKGDGTEKNPGKIVIKDSTNDNTIVFSLVIPQTNLIEYHCALDSYMISVDFKIIHDIIKNMSDCSKLTFSISKYKEQELNMVAYTKSRTQEIRASINLLINSHKSLPDLNINYISQIIIGSEKLHSACKSISNFGTFLNIICDKDKLTLSSRDTDTLKSKFSMTYKTVNNQSKITSDSLKDNVIINFDSDFLKENQIPIIRSTYELQNIINFDKLKSLVSYIDIRMGADNEPLCLSYEIPKIGKFVVFICAMAQKVSAN